LDTIIDLFLGWTFLHSEPLMDIATVEEQMIPLDFNDLNVYDGQADIGPKETM
jgi:hypothetical protein